MDFVSETFFTPIVQILLTIVIGVYVVFALIVFNKIRRLGLMVFISASFATTLINTFALVHLIGSIALLLIAIAIVII